MAQFGHRPSVAPVTGTFTGAGQSAAFSPAVLDSSNGGSQFWVWLRGTFVGSVQLERMSPNDTVWVPLTANGNQLYAFSGPACETAEDDVAGVQYRLNCTSYTSGTITYGIEQ